MAQHKPALWYHKPNTDEPDLSSIYYNASVAAQTPVIIASNVRTARAEQIANCVNSQHDLLEALEGLLNIVADSKGVDGFHLNGDIALWNEFEEIEIAESILAKVKS